MLRVGKDYTKAEVKELLQNIYSKLDIPGNPSASDISDYLTCEDRTNRMEGKKVAVTRRMLMPASMVLGSRLSAVSPLVW